MKASELKAILVGVPDDVEVFIDFPTPVFKKIYNFCDPQLGDWTDDQPIPDDDFSMSIERVDTSWGANERVVTIIPDEIIRC